MSSSGKVGQYCRCIYHQQWLFFFFFAQKITNVILKGSVVRFCICVCPHIHLCTDVCTDFHIQCSVQNKTQLSGSFCQPLYVSKKTLKNNNKRKQSPPSRPPSTPSPAPPHQNSSPVLMSSCLFFFKSQTRTLSVQVKESKFPLHKALSAELFLL